MLILTSYIAKHELKALDRFLNSGAKKVIKGLGIETKSPGSNSGFRFFKVRIGKNNGARLIVFIMTKNKKIVPVLIRLKKDKIFGTNMAMNNPNVANQISKNLDHILEDIESDRYEEFSLE